MLHQQSQSLANVRSRLWSTTWTLKGAAAAASWSWRTAPIESTNLAKLARDSNEIDGIIEGCQVFRSPCLAGVEYRN